MTLALVTLILNSACASGILQDTKTCYVPSTPKESREAMQADFAECGKTSRTPNQHSACMYTKGYNVETCYRHNDKPVSGAEVIKAGKGATLQRAQNELSLSDLE